MNESTFSRTLKKKFAISEPIFTDELLKVFSKCSRAQLFRYIRNAKASNMLKQFNKGIYYLPKQTSLGLFTINVEDVVEKKYIKSDGDVYGIYSGIELLNMFGVTTQMASIVEIVSNNESSKKREIVINGRCFILKKSRCLIDKNNYPEYMLLELFNLLGKNETINSFAKNEIMAFIKKTNVTTKKILNLSIYFPSKAIKNLLRSGIINEITWE